MVLALRFPLISLDLMDVLVDTNLLVSLGKLSPQKENGKSGRFLNDG
jgi:hypothetical protein